MSRTRSWARWERIDDCLHRRGDRATTGRPRRQSGLSARDPAKAAAAAKRVEGDAHALPIGLNVADQASVRAAADYLSRSPGALDVLINDAAGYVDWGEVASSADLEAAHDVLEVNLFGAWRLTNALLGLLRASDHPRVVHVSSGADGMPILRLGSRDAAARPPRAQCAGRDTGGRTGGHARDHRRRLPGADSDLSRRPADGRAAGRRRGRLRDLGGDAPRRRTTRRAVPRR